jgi:hypothetical protein
LLIKSTIFTFFLIDSLIASEITSFVYKGCANQNFQDQSGPKNLNNLLNTFISQSAQKGFSTATIGGDGSGSGVTGLFQCRGDLTLTQCNTCVKKIPSLLEKYCSGEPTAARIQLNGCYLKYEVVGFQNSSDTELLYKVCGSAAAAAGGGGSGFESKRDTAFDTAVNGVKNGTSGTGGGGFYAGNYESVYVLGQCEGDLSSGDCGDCVKIGFESVKSECGKDAIDEAQIYLNKCYVSFRYYPNGGPKISDTSSSSGIETKRHTQRTVAIAVGGTAAFGFLLVVFLFVISVMKKKKSSTKKHGASWN